MAWTTVEIRWFLPGAPPPAVETWLLDAPVDWDGVEARADAYLRLGGAEDLGVKVREGQLESKGRLGRVGPVHLGPRCAGWLERWAKWSCAAEPAARALRGHAPTVEVVKRRVQRAFRLPPGGAPAPADERPDRGATLELARLEVGGAPWWSLAAEAGPADPALGEDLLALLRPLLGRCPVALPAEDSLGYPALLARRAR